MKTRTACVTLALIGALLPAPSSSAPCPQYGDYLHVVGDAAIPGCPHDVAISGNYAYVTTGSPSGLDVLDLTIPDHPTRVGHLDTPADGCITISDSHAYLTGGGDAAVLYIIDLEDPVNPRAEGSVQLPMQGNAIAICHESGYPNAFACVAGGSAGLVLVDIGDPANPRILSTIKTSSYEFGVTVEGTVAYVAGESMFSAVDVSDPLQPRILGSLEAGYQYFRVVAVGGYAYAACGLGLEVIDISDPTQPRRLSDVYTGGWTIAIQGTHAYMTDLSGVVAADVTDPEAPRVVGDVAFADLHFDANALALSGDHVYVADCELGLVVVDVSQVETAERPMYSGIGDIAFDYYLACLVVPGGIALYDFWDPLEPRLLGSGTMLGSGWEVVVRGIYAYLADGTGGLAVFDLSDTKDPHCVGDVGTPGTARGVALSGSYAYVADYGSGLQVIDVSDPTWPVIVSSVPIPRQYVYAVALSEGYAYLAVGRAGLYVVDIRDPRSPAIVSHLGTTDARKVVVSGSYAYVADESGGLRVIDVSNPAIPQLTATVNTGSNITVVAVDGNNAFCADAALVHWIDISTPSDPQVTATLHVPKIGRILVRHSDLYLAGANGLVILKNLCAPGVVADPVGAPGGLKLGVLPNPARGSAVLRLELPSASPVRATILDICGRLVRSLDGGAMDPGAHYVPWDGRDSEGRKVAPGIYLARVVTRDGAVSRRIVMLR